MSKFNRRDLMVGAGGLVTSLLVRRTVAEAGGSSHPAGAGGARRGGEGHLLRRDAQRPVSLDGERQGSGLAAVPQGAEARTRARCSTRFPGRAALLARLQQLSGDTAVTRRGGRAPAASCSFEQRPVGADNFKLFVQEGRHRPRAHPTRPSRATPRATCPWTGGPPHRMARSVVYGLSKDGSEDSIAAHPHRGRRRDLPEQIPNTETAHPQWLDDGSGFFYNQLTGRVDTPERYLDSQARFHRLGTDPDRRPDPDEARPRCAECSSSASRCRSLRPSKARTTRCCCCRTCAARCASSSPRWPMPWPTRRTGWRSRDFADEVTSAEIDGETLYLLHNKAHPRGRVLQGVGPRPGLEAATEAVPTEQWVHRGPAPGRATGCTCGCSMAASRGSSAWRATDT